MTEPFVREFDGRVQVLLGGLKAELAGIRTNRPSPELLENVKVAYAGTELTIKQLGTIGVQPPRDLLVTVWDKAMAAAVAKAIEQAGLGFTPNVDGNVVRMALPPLTDERRAELMKLAKRMAEGVRIRLRAERDETNKRIAKAAEEERLREDEKFQLKQDVQKRTEAANGDINRMLEVKSKEIMD